MATDKVMVRIEPTAHEALHRLVAMLSRELGTRVTVAQATSIAIHEAHRNRQGKALAEAEARIKGKKHDGK